MKRARRPAALLMTYGSPVSLEREDVAAYLARVRGGRSPEPELVDEFTRRYRVIGGSPLAGATRAQAEALAESLGWPVEIGMRFSEPSISTALDTLLEKGVTEVAAIVLSPQYSPLLMGGYEKAIGAALTMLPQPPLRVLVAGAWYDRPGFVAALARRVIEVLASLSPADQRGVHVLMTAHSIPRRVADSEPAYIAQLSQTAAAVASEAGLSPPEWTFCWQSAGHEPGEWMRPDFEDLMPELAASGVGTVLVAPVQFLADHLETLYDIDIAAREQAVSRGLDFRRIEALGTDPHLIEALRDVARSTLAGPS